MDKIEREFWKFHTANPQVYDALVKLALDLLRRGWQQYSIKGLFEVVRHRRAMTTTGIDASTGGHFKLCNNHTALYARLIMRNVKELDGFFRLKRRSPRGTQHYEPEDGSISELGAA